MPPSSLYDLEGSFDQFFFQWEYIQKAITQTIRKGHCKHYSEKSQDETEIRFLFGGVICYARLVHNFKVGQVEYGIIREEPFLPFRHRAITTLPLSHFWREGRHPDWLVGEIEEKHYKILSDNLVAMAEEFFRSSSKKPY